MKHCQQGGALPQAKFLRSEYVPRLFDQHFQVLKTLVADTPVGIVADETTDIRDHSILNVALVRGKCYLVCVEKMVACNNATFSQAIIKSVSDVGIKFEYVTAIVSDSAGYCKKAFKDVLSVVFSNSIQVRCLAHIVNFASEIFHQHSYLKYTADLIVMIKSAFLKNLVENPVFLHSCLIIYQQAK